jgi:hypothetical protein
MKKNKGVMNSVLSSRLSPEIPFKSSVINMFVDQSPLKCNVKAIILHAIP